MSNYLFEKLIFGKIIYKLLKFPNAYTTLRLNKRIGPSLFFFKLVMKHKFSKWNSKIPIRFFYYVSSKQHFKFLTNVKSNHVLSLGLTRLMQILHSINFKTFENFFFIYQGLGSTKPKPFKKFWWNTNSQNGIEKFLFIFLYMLRQSIIHYVTNRTKPITQTCNETQIYKKVHIFSSFGQYSSKIPWQNLLWNTIIFI